MSSPIGKLGLGSFLFARRYLGNCVLTYLFSIPPGTRMFYFPGCTPSLKTRQEIKSLRFPHSEISGSKVARHLPEAYRRHAASFIAMLCQGIHHTPLYFPLGNKKTTITFVCYLLYHTP